MSHSRCSICDHCDLTTPGDEENPRGYTYSKVFDEYHCSACRQSIQMSLAFLEERELYLLSPETPLELVDEAMFLTDDEVSEVLLEDE